MNELKFCEKSWIGKFLIKQMLKISVFYIDKQKSFIPKKIWSVPSLHDSSFFNRRMAPWRPNFPNPRPWLQPQVKEILRPTFITWGHA